METRKRLYIGLLVSSMLIVMLLVITTWYLMQNRDIILSKILLFSIIFILGAIFVILGIGILSIIIMIIKSKSFSSLDSIIRIANDVLFPITILTGRIAGISKDKIQRSYIAVNNNLVKSKKLLLKGSQVMILLPHCLQDSDCPHKITMDINNCKKCGKCCISDIIDLGQKYDAIIKVATGGTMARRFIRDCRAKGVIAVACERDLSSGIQESGLLPVMGVLNCRPNGPCINTNVEIDKIEQALLTICKGG
ncbi:MAG: DUF116 domain-containing protein [Syntrophomonas sp.]|nr:DUF116 domain-containing protein [Syntrophomonas sp.]